MQYRICDGCPEHCHLDLGESCCEIGKEAAPLPRNEPHANYDTNSVSETFSAVKRGKALCS